MPNWKERLRAAAIHLIISLCIATLAATLVFGFWYPYPYREISGGRELFLLLIAVDVAMGPLITLIIFNRAKPRRELFMDFTAIGLLQLAALSYGLWTVFVARPAYLVFEYSRFSIAHAVEIDPAQLAKAPSELRQLPLNGPGLIALRPFKDATEQFDATMAALEGAALSARCDLWQPYTLAVPQVLKAARPANELADRFPQQANAIAQAVKEAGKPLQELRYLPVLGRNVAWTVLLDANSATPLAFLPLDSFD